MQITLPAETEAIFTTGITSVHVSEEPSHESFDSLQDMPWDSGKISDRIEIKLSIFI